MFGTLGPGFALRPCPSSNALSVWQLAKSSCKDRPHLRNLLAVDLERHRRRTHNVCAVAGNVGVQRLVERHVVVARSVVLGLFSTSLYQSSAAVGPCQTWGAIPSRIDPGSVNHPDIAFTSPLLNASMYPRTAA